MVHTHAHLPTCQDTPGNASLSPSVDLGVPTAPQPTRPTAFPTHLGLSGGCLAHQQSWGIMKKRGCRDSSSSPLAPTALLASRAWGRTHTRIDWGSKTDQSPTGGAGHLITINAFNPNKTNEEPEAHRQRHLPALQWQKVAGPGFELWASPQTGGLSHRNGVHRHHRVEVP